MNSNELKTLQFPLKEQYREYPKTALVTLRAQGNLGDGISCKIETGNALKEAGLHPAKGGDGFLACSGDMLLEALVACAGVTLKAVSTAVGIENIKGKVNAEGDIDFRGTLAVSKEVPVGFKTIRLNFSIDTEVSEEQITTLSKLTERYCIVYQTLIKGTNILTSYNKK